MLDAHQEIAAFCTRSALAADRARELQDLVDRLLQIGGFGRRSVLTTLLHAQAPVDLEAPVDAPRAPLPVSETEARPRPTDRYEDLGLLGVGGMGEVRRVRDRDLNRTLAMKVIRPELMSKPAIVSRFVEEAQVGAQLQHPGMAPIHEFGKLPDGRMYFTMKEIRGRPFAEQIRDAHASEGDPGDLELRRLCDTFAKVCDAVAYAHNRGVIHRDLKPENVMVGGYGEVLVIDWGLAKVVGRAESSVDWSDEDAIHSGRDSDAQRTRVGSVLGTAAYMAPEQARGELHTVDARADVYALGAILYEVLAGRPPYEGRDSRAVLRQVLAGPPEPPGRAVGPLAAATFTLDVAADDAGPDRALPEELVRLCERAMARDPAERPADATVMALEIRAWLDGAKRREAAIAVVAEAEAQDPAADALRRRAAALRAEAAVLLAGVKPWEPEEVKAPGWAREDEAEALERQAALRELTKEALLRGALTHAPDLTEAHAGLVELELARHAAAEAGRDERRIARAEVRLREHVEALPEDNEVRRRAAAYLKGDGALTLVTDVPGAEVDLFRYEVRNRRLVAVPVRSLGRTPLREVSLTMGSYLCLLRHPERAEVRYPVFIERGQHWDGAQPGERDPLPVRLPRLGELGPDDCLMPAGWFWSGGDAEVKDSLPRRRLWCDDLVVKQFPVTNSEYVAFLDDLVATGREAEALRHQPRERAAGDGPPVYCRGEAGRFVLQPDTDGDVWGSEWPVILVDWFGASAYAAWLAERTGRPWRLLGELEWEKAARGVDGRFYPWGDGFDPSWCCVRSSHPGTPSPQVVDSYSADVSVYGVRGLGGNVQDWCANVLRRAGPVLDGDRVVPPSSHDVVDTSLAYVFRGGSWVSTPRDTRSVVRNRNVPGIRAPYLGLRVACRPGG